MSNTLADQLWRTPLRRGPYTVRCLISFAILHNLGRVLDPQPFLLSSWNPFSYWAHLAGAPQFLLEFGTIGLLLAALLATWTVRRLLDAGLSPWLTLTLFLPVVNLVCIALFCVMPCVDEPRRYENWLARALPTNRLGSASLAAAVTGIFGTVMVVVGTQSKLGSAYGWGLFVVLPFCMGVLAALLHGYHRPRTLRESLRAAVLSLILLMLGLIGLGIEGLICILMVAPIGTILAILGALVGHRVQASRRPSPSVATLLVVVLSVPCLMGTEYLVRPETPRIEIVTVVEINAPPAVVWRNLIAFPSIAPPEEWLFRAGVSYPISARLISQGLGAQRFCEFSTGTIIEEITAWDENRRMDFRVISAPPTMREMSPYTDLHPPHLSGYLHPREAHFTLTPLPGRRTRLEGRSWYQNEMWPHVYWQLWSDAIVKRIHRRVFTHIKELSEKLSVSPTTPSSNAARPGPA